MSSSSDSTLPGLPAPGRLLGVDYGTKRVGFSLSNLEQSIATPLQTHARRDAPQDARRLKKLVEEYTVVGLVVGLPVHMSGDEGQKAREAREYGAWAAAVTGLPVAFCDERYTTALADEQLRDAGLGPRQRQARRDMLAAQILLQSYLESRRSDEPPAALM